MPTKIRLSRQGRKKKPFYHIVVTDSRVPRDGKYIEKIGTYNPVTNPATIDLDFDRALTWLQTGAQPTETCRSILSSRGVLMKKHLLEGVKKGAFDEAAAEEKFNAWLQDKEGKMSAEKEKLSKKEEEEKKKRLDAEQKIREERAAALMKKQSDLAEEAAAEEEAPTEASSEEPQAKAEEPKAEETKTEEPAAENKEEGGNEEKKEEGTE